MVNLEDIKKRLSDLFLSFIGYLPDKIEALTGAGSNRLYYRLSGVDRCVIGVYGEDKTENKSFCRLARYFFENGCHVPELYTHSDDYSVYLQEDLGQTQLFDILKEERGVAIIKQCMIDLSRLQTLPKDCWASFCFNSPFNWRQVMWDLNYFKYEYLKSTGIVFDENALEDDFESMASLLTRLPVELTGFMYRDCQSRNVMIKADTPYWIDFQGGRVGPCVYDAISFLWQAKAGLSREFRQEMLSLYAHQFAAVRNINAKDVLKSSKPLILFRTLQVLGAYGFRGLVEHKAHFVESIPGALANLSELINEGVLDSYKELKRVCHELIKDERFVKKSDEQGLIVEVFSFSYKKGYPANYTSNGGGFMFDCRGLHNPGRYDEYKPLTGLDLPVREFLEQRGEIQPFLEAAWQMTDQAVAAYLRRGFTSLQIGFGCTGGRHRSVYSADCTARHIAEKFPEAKVIVNHREQQIKQTL